MSTTTTIRSCQRMIREPLRRMLPFRCLLSGLTSLHGHLFLLHLPLKLLHSPSPLLSLIDSIRTRLFSVHVRQVFRLDL